MPGLRPTTCAGTRTGESGGSAARQFLLVCPRADADSQNREERYARFPGRDDLKPRVRGDHKRAGQPRGVVTPLFSLCLPIRAGRRTEAVTTPGAGEVTPNLPGMAINSNRGQA